MHSKQNIPQEKNIINCKVGQLIKLELYYLIAQSVSIFKLAYLFFNADFLNLSFNIVCVSK